MAKLYVGTSSGKKEISIASEESVSTLTSNFNSFKSSANSSISNINTKITSLQSSSNKSLKSINIGTLSTSNGYLNVTNDNLIGLDYIIIDAYCNSLTPNTTNKQIIVPNGCTQRCIYSEGASSNYGIICSYDNTTGKVYVTYPNHCSSETFDITVYYFA